MKVTLITGASGGIGEAIARKIAARKENLLLIARSENQLRRLCSELAEQFDVQAAYITTDLAEPRAAEMIYNECCKRGYEVNSLINNAGKGSGGDFSELELQQELAIMQLNMNALVSLTHFFLRDMKARRSGTIVNIGSLIAFMPVPYMAVYGASKAFVRSFTQALYEEAKPYCVHVMLFNPGLTQTNFMKAAELENHKGEALTANGRLQTAEQVAAEFDKAYLIKQRFAVSGRVNRFLVKLMGLIPNTFIAKQTASAYQKKIMG